MLSPARKLVPALALLVPALVRGQTLPDRPSIPELDPLIAEALANHPEVAAANASMEAAHARIRQAAALPDPTVTLTYQNDGYRPESPGATDDTWLGVSAEQMLPFPGKRKLAVEIAGHAASEAGYPASRARLSLEAETRRAFTDLLLARELISLLDEQEATWNQIEAATRARYSVGLGAQQDVLRAQAERTRLSPMRYHEQGNEEAAIAALNRLMGRPAGTPIPTPRRLSEVVSGERPLPLPDLAGLERLAEEGSPELAMARVVIARSRLEVDLAKKNLNPDFVASAAYMNRGSTPPMWSVGLGVVLPVFRGQKQRQGIVEAEARLRAAEAEERALRLALRASLEKDLAELRGAVREVEPYAKGVLVQDRLSVQSALANYEAGKVPFVTVLEALSTLFSDRRDYTDRLAHVLWHEASLRKLAPAERIAPAAPGWGAPSMN